MNIPVGGFDVSLIQKKSEEARFESRNIKLNDLAPEEWFACFAILGPPGHKLAGENVVGLSTSAGPKPLSTADHEVWPGLYQASVISKFVKIQRPVTIKTSPRLSSMMPPV